LKEAMGTPMYFYTKSGTKEGLSIVFTEEYLQHMLKDKLFIVCQ
jgi:hypothetical protein